MVATAKLDDAVARRLDAHSIIIHWSVEMHRNGRMPDDVRRAFEFIYETSIEECERWAPKEPCSLSPRRRRRIWTSPSPTSTGCGSALSHVRSCGQRVRATEVSVYPGRTQIICGECHCEVVVIEAPVSIGDTPEWAR